MGQTPASQSPIGRACVPDSPLAPSSVFSQAQLTSHARALAAGHTLADAQRRCRALLPRLDESAEQLEVAYQLLSAIARTDPQPVASEDWLRDNYHLIQDQVADLQQDLTRKVYLELPKLAEGPCAGFPRVYLIARELVAHTAGRLDLDTLVSFSTAYQRIAPWSIGETWAITTMLRLTLVEELRRMIEGVVSARRSREEAHGDSLDELLRLAHQREATGLSAIGNVITSMRLLSSIDWPLFFDRVSMVEQILKEDPVGVYVEMDFPTRDRYRQSIEELSRGAAQLEIVVARHAIALARDAQDVDPLNDRRHHVGYYLISRGRFVLEKVLRYKPPVNQRLARCVFQHPALGYLGAIAASTLLGVAALREYGRRQGAAAGELWLIVLIAVIPVSELAISLLNVLLTSQIAPRQLPKLAMRSGIPAQDRTMVVVPAIIDSESGVESLFHDLEVRFLANRDPHLHFALLTDFTDARQAVLPGDETLMRAARRKVDELNARHGPDRFYLFHRQRRWNAGERSWMGWERKRGKLAEFNRLLRGASDTSFVVCHGDLSILRSVKYVITLDSDTRLPMEAARRLVGTLSHPLNRPRFDSRVRQVTEGYGVLQPRVQVGIESASRTMFARVFAGHVGLDPYPTAVSDVYQDLFHEGSYVGKGIYEVNAFDAALAGRVPENTLLSHDLFEGFYARAGLCSDIGLVDEDPTNYLAFAARQHRWVRGDWQIIRWLWRTVPDASGRAVPNTLSAVSLWKIADNLRRSLLSPALVVMFIGGWTVLPGSVVVWSVLGLLVLAFPACIQVGRSLASRVRGVTLRAHMLAERDTLDMSARQVFLSIVLLLHQSWVMLDAIGRTLVRLLITRTHLLDWVTADRSTRVETSAAAVFRRMAPVTVMAAVIGVGVTVIAPARLPYAIPVLVLWGLSPVLVYATGRPLQQNRVAVNSAGRLVFRRMGHWAWRFFR